MKRSVKILALSIISFCSLGAAAVSTVAWFSADTKTDFVDGGAVASYFKSGDGTEEDPYIISSRNHVYNLAWLQYIGYFNADRFGGIQQLYFEVENDIDMDGLAIPPIGTETYPFLSHFDGNGNTISNFTISNDDPEQDESDFGVAKPVNLYDGEPSNIIGFFGVVGQLPDGNITYDSSLVSISSVNIDNFTITSETTQTLIGLAAGYVNGVLSDFRVGESTIDVNGCEPITSITNNLSDYSLVGYASTTSTISDFTKKVSEKLNQSESGGNVGGFGASVNFKDYLELFYSIHQNKGYEVGSKPSDMGYISSTTLTDSNITRYNSKAGSSGNYYIRFNLPGSQMVSDPEAAFTVTFVQAPASGNYLNLSFSFRSTATSGNYTGFYREYGYTGTYEQSFTATTTTANSRWHLTFATGVPRFSNYTSFDLHKYSGVNTGVTKTDTDGSNSANRLINVTFQYADAHIFHLTNGSYIPLKLSDDYSSAANDNTGYIVGVGLASNTNYVGGASPRVSSYSVSYLNNSITSGTINNVYTVDNNGTKQTITETKTDGVVTSTSPSYERYITSRTVVGETFDGADVSNGIHFDVSATNKYSNSSYYRGSVANDSSDTYIEEQMLLKSYNGTKKTTRMPKGSIDFELEDSGYINFFAGMYNVSPDVTQLNFFSLHHVIRTSPTAYTLKEIKKIYRSTSWTADSPNYVYEYTDSTYSSGTRTGEAIFDVSTALWTPRNKDNSLYYFEIPVNKGEYAMGAVDASHTNNTAYQGAYLIYLDIGSNGHSSGNTNMDAYFVETSFDSNIFPGGVDFNITGLSAVGGNTACFALTYNNSPVTGSIWFNPEDSQVVVDSRMTGAGCIYDAGSVFNGSSSTQTISDLTDSGGGGYRLIRAAIETATGEEWEIEYQEILDGSGAITSYYYSSVIKDDADVTSSVNSSSLSVPIIFTSNIASIKEKSVAVQLMFHGFDFSISDVTYSAPSVNISVPTEELGTTSLTISFPSGNYSALYINESLYQP